MVILQINEKDVIVNLESTETMFCSIILLCHRWLKLADDCVNIIAGSSSDKNKGAQEALREFAFIHV